MYRVSHFVTQFALCLLAGAAVALAWANLSPRSYQDFVELRLADNSLIGYPNPDSLMPLGRTLTLGYLAGDALMAFFFLYIGKELWESLALRHGALRGARSVAPLVTALVAAAVPALLYAGLAHFVTAPVLPSPAAGWPVPMAGDVALSYVVGRLALGPGHPALRFLLLVSIADDILALLVTGLAFPVGTLQPLWLLLPLGAALTAYLGFNALPRRLDRGDPLKPAARWVRHHLAVWPYAVAGALSWYGTQQAGLMPALGLLPVIPAIPHADHAFGMFAEAEEMLPDMLNRIAKWLVMPVGAILFLFALTHAGAPLASADSETLAVALALLIGKPLGILLGGALAMRGLGAALPAGMAPRDLAATVRDRRDPARRRAQRGRPAWAAGEPDRGPAGAAARPRNRAAGCVSRPLRRGAGLTAPRPAVE